MRHKNITNFIIVSVIAVTFAACKKQATSADDPPVVGFDVLSQELTQDVNTAALNVYAHTFDLYGYGYNFAPDAIGTATTEFITTTYTYDGSWNYRRAATAKAMGTWQFESLEQDFCYLQFNAPKSVVHGGQYKYQCKVFVSNGDPVSDEVGESESLDANGEAVLDGNYVGDQLNEGQQFLFPGDGLISENGLYTLLFLSDGDLVMYDDTYAVIWETYTQGDGGGGSHTHLQDGNLVVYDADVSPVFASNTGDHYGAYLWCQNDGNLVIYDAYDNVLWAIW